jgi:hypothetical protein
MRYRTLTVVALPLVALLAGCGGRERYASSDFTPPADTARQSLEAALDAWKAGRAPGAIEGTTPPVEVVDSQWKAGQKLDGYEVLAEDQADGTKQYSVRLSFKAPAAAKEVRYHIIGRDPVRVYRDEDYRRMINMEDNPKPTAGAGF